jgi:hypothetical protein
VLAADKETAMDLPALAQLIDLRFVQDNEARGYAFEQAIRELVPWDFRPPLAVLARGEQIDAFFEWNSWHFLVEAKAKRKSITRGSHDWEDFELKIRRRMGSAIGLYCSLFPVSKTVEDAAEELNRGGYPTILLHGSVWDNILEQKVPITDLLRYMVWRVKATGKPVPPDIKQVGEWLFDRASVVSKVESTCRLLSGVFLRRHALPNHSLLYVRRQLDVRIDGLASQLRPLSLTDEHRIKQHTRTIQGAQLEYTTPRTLVPQVCVIRDSSGCGKTTLAVQVALTTEPFLGIARAASETDIDETLTSLDDIGSRSGLEDLVKLNRPIVLVIDSLDEASNIPDKRSEIVSLLRAVEELNAKSRESGFTQFPILVVFTVREDYWRQWESVFEGMCSTTFRKQFTTFDPPEAALALNNYAQGYHYVLSTEPGPEAKAVLSVPFNLHVFSEANEFRDHISFADVFDEQVLHLYFERKCDNVTKRRVPGLSSETFMRLAGAFAMEALRHRRRMITRQEAQTLITTLFPHLRGDADAVILALLSEQIMLRDPENPSQLTFRHSRFIEYLVAAEIIRNYEEGRRSLEDMTGEVFESGVVSMYRVHDFIRFICRREYPHLFDEVMDAYARSDRYMCGNLLQLRDDVARGGRLGEDDIVMIRRSLHSSSSSGAWDAFYALAAKANALPGSSILEAFEVAWKSNAANSERWRLLDRLTSRDLVLQPIVLEFVVESGQPREWEFLLGTLLESPGLREQWKNEFAELSYRIEATLCKHADANWDRVRQLWVVLKEDHEYILGDFPIDSAADGWHEQNKAS